ncbi:phasin family protein [Pseudaminobacter soli (ex Li et al. 2025)]|uniref:Phasin n=1 Tax=Pseudaminobacter soli (ex Li et al. 2025) TaxID=1295366 RepID=A0A2P7SBY9_9HYPH|nr:phasin family protein [Mesorhizobium soli]PSJ59835.1 Phasin [Mesorhizobium soli]
MLQSFDEANKFGKEFVDSGLKSFAAISKSAQAIAVEATEYTKKSFETGTATFEKVMSSGSLEKALEIQTDYAKQAYEGFVAEATKMSELYADLAKEAYKPFESVVAKAK